MTDRLAQARAEAERQFPDGTWMAREQDRIIFTKGWQAADANPQPHTITRSELAHMSWMLQCLSEDRIAAVLPGLLGIEVEDGDA